MKLVEVCFYEDLVNIPSFTVVNRVDYHGYHTDTLFTLFVIVAAHLERERKRKRI